MLWENTSSYTAIHEIRLEIPRLAYANQDDVID